jgi:hypothetical protein
MTFIPKSRTTKWAPGDLIWDVMVNRLLFVVTVIDDSSYDGNDFGGLALEIQFSHDSNSFVGFFLHDAWWSVYPNRVSHPCAQEGL